MKITEDSPERLTVTCRRLIVADVALALFVFFGLLVCVGIVRSEFTQFTPVFAVSGLHVAIFGIVCLFRNAAAQVTFDTADRSLTLCWRRLFDTQTRTVAFDDLARIRLHDDDGCQTIEFVLQDRSIIFLEKAYSGNRKAKEVARYLDDWMRQRGWQPGAT